QLVGGSGLPDAERQAAVLLELLPEADRSEPAVLVVQRCDPAGRRDPHTVAHRLDVLLVGHTRKAPLELPRCLLVEDARRRTALAADDDASLDLDADAACDPVAGDPEGGDGRQGWVERADRPVPEDHVAERSRTEPVRPLRAGPRHAAAKPRRRRSRGS